MIVTLIQLAVFFGVPAISLWACKRSKILRAISPVVLCYGLGITFGNVVPLQTLDAQFAYLDVPVLVAEAASDPIAPPSSPAGSAMPVDGESAPDEDSHDPGKLAGSEKTTNLIAGLCVILAIGMLMVSTDFKKWLRLAKVTIIGAVLAMVSAVLVTTISAVALRAYSDKLWQAAGMLVGVYTGGTINLAAIARALNVDSITWGVVHTSDIVVTGIYFLLLLTVGPKFFGLFLKPFKRPEGAEDVSEDESPGAPIRTLDVVRSVGVGLLIVALPLGLSQVVPSTMEEPVAIIGVTTVAILLSFARPLRQVHGLYETGDFMLLVFCVAVGSLATVGRLVNADPFFFVYTTVVVICAVGLHTGLCALFRVDRDTTIITSVAALYGPPFVPPVAAKLGNREIVVSGVTSGLVGLAAGNYLGLMVAYTVKYLAGQ